MKYDVVKQSFEEDFQSRWSTTAIQFDTVGFNPQALTEYVAFSVKFGDATKRSLPVGCYRVPGLLIVSAFTKPGKGSVRKLQVATALAEMYLNAVIRPTSPLVARVVKMFEPSLFDDD